MENGKRERKPISATAIFAKRGHAEIERSRAPLAAAWSKTLGEFDGEARKFGTALTDAVAAWFAQRAQQNEIPQAIWKF